MATQYRIEWPFVFPDGRVEGGLFPPDYYKYPTDLFGGTWEQGLKAIEDYDWRPRLSERNENGQDGAASEQVAAEHVPAVAYDTSAGKLEVVGEDVKINDRIGAPRQEPEVEVPAIHVVPPLSEEKVNVESLDTNLNVQSVNEHNAGATWNQSTEDEHLPPTSAASQSAMGPSMPKLSAQIPRSPKPPESLDLNHSNIGEPKIPRGESLEINEIPDADAETPTTTAEAKHVTFSDPIVTEVNLAESMSESTEPRETKHTATQPDSEAMDMDDSEAPGLEIGVDAPEAPGPEMGVDNPEPPSPKMGVGDTTLQANEQSPATEIREDLHITVVNEVQGTAADAARAGQLHGSHIPEMQSPATMIEKPDTSPAEPIEDNALSMDEVMNMEPPEAVAPESTEMNEIKVHPSPDVGQETGTTLDERQPTKDMDLKSTNAESLPQGNPTNVDLASPAWEPIQIPSPQPQGTTKPSSPADATISGNPSTPDNSRPLRNMPFGPPTSPFVEIEASTPPPQERDLAVSTPPRDAGISTWKSNSAATELPGSNSTLFHTPPESAVPESTDAVKPAQRFEFDSSHFLAGLEEAANAESPTDGHQTTPLNPMTPEDTNAMSIGSSPWAGALLEQHLTEASMLPPSPYGPVNHDAQSPNANEVNESSLETATQTQNELDSHVHDKMSRLSLQSPSAVPAMLAPEHPPTMPNLPHGPTQVGDSMPAPHEPVTPEVKTANARKRAKPTSGKKKSSNKKDTALFKPEESSESDDGKIVKKGKTNTPSKAKATPDREEAKDPATSDIKGAIKQLPRSEEILGKSHEADRHEVEREQEAKRSGSPDTTQDNTTVSSTRPPASLASTNDTATPKTLALGGTDKATTTPVGKSRKPAQPKKPARQLLHELDLGYGKRHTRADSRQDQITSKRSAASSLLDVLPNPPANSNTKPTPGAATPKAQKGKPSAKPAAQTKRKRKTLPTTLRAEDEQPYNDGNVEEDDAAAYTDPEPIPKSKKRKPAPLASATPTAKPAAAHAKTPASRTNTPKSAPTLGTPSSTASTPNKYGFKPPTGRRKPRAEGNKGRAKKVAEVEVAEESEVVAGPEGLVRRQTRRSSAAQEQMEREAEKEGNIGKRLRSGDVGK